MTRPVGRPVAGFIALPNRPRTSRTHPEDRAARERTDSDALLSSASHQVAGGPGGGP